MCSISDIPIVGAAVNHISEASVGAVSRGIRYILFYKDNVNKLKSEIQGLETKEREIKRQVDQAKNNGKTIEERVVKWQDDVKVFKAGVTEFLGKYEGRTSWGCFIVLRCPNPCRRFQLGRWAAKKTTTVIELSDLVKNRLTVDISYFPPIEYSPISSTEYQKFGSREVAYEKILKALNYKEDGFPVVGVYGFGGVGKTRMMEEASKEVKAQGIFKTVARANVGQVEVGQKVDMIGKIQDQLATCLGITEKSEDRTSQLKARLSKGDTILVILDDVWSEIPFAEIGIPFGDSSIKGCKILVTSRLRDVCIKNKCKDPVKIEALTEEEAWDMFTKTVDISTIESVNDDSLAKQVCNKCARLPLIIGAVGKALQKKMCPDFWKDALRQLENCKPEKIPGIPPDAYACLRLSFNILDRDAYLCLLLCSLAGEDEEIRIEFLFRLATGSGLLEDWNTLADARNRVNAMVSELKSSLLLLEGRHYDSVKLHDIIRDVARSITHDKESEYKFLSERKCHSLRSKKEILISRKLIYLDFKSDNVDFFDDLEPCPDLHSLYLKYSNLSDVQLPDSFFKSFPKLKYLLLDIKSLSARTYIESLPVMSSCIQYLDSLRSLTIHRCKVNDISHIIQLKNLEMLSLQNSRFGGQLLDLRQLRRLRMLDLLWCTEIGGIVLSGLVCLEELYLPTFCNILDGETKRKTPLSSVTSKLTSLEIYFEDVKSCPDEIFCKNLCRYNISVGGSSQIFPPFYLAMKSVYLWDDSIGGGVKTLVWRGEAVMLERVRGLQECFSQGGGAFTDLKELTINECTGGDEYPFRIHRQPHERVGPFSKLSKLRIYNSGFKYLFCTSTARCLQQLEVLSIGDCVMMEEIVRNEGQTNEFIYFPKLRVLDLVSLPVLKSLGGKISFPSLEVLSFDGLKINLEEIYLGRDYLDDSTSKLTEVDVSNCNFHECDLFSLLGNSSWKNNPYGTISFRRLQQIKVNSCMLSTIFTCSIAKGFQELERLEVRSCGLIEEIVTDERCNDQLVVDTCEEISFPKLRAVILENLPNLKSFYPSQNYCFKMPSLERVDITRCPQMRSFTPGQISTPEVYVSIEYPSLDGERYIACKQRTTDINSYLHQIMNTQELFVDKKEELKSNHVDKGKSIVTG